MKLFAILAALCVALCWGSYGTVLANARSPERLWGPFKPYLFVGMAYVVVSILFGSLMMRFAFSDNFDYTGKYFPAMKWGFLAGLLGAFGALFLTISLTKAAGHPSYVMPLVFGGAVTVNAIIAYFSLPTGYQVNPLMWLGMLLVAVGIVLTASNTPHGHPPKPPAESAPADSPDHASAAPTSAGAEHVGEVPEQSESVS